MTTCLAGRLAKHFLDPDSMDEATVREHVIFADLNLYPKDVMRYWPIKTRSAPSWRRCDVMMLASAYDIVVVGAVPPVKSPPFKGPRPARRSS